MSKYPFCEHPDMEIFRQIWAGILAAFDELVACGKTAKNNTVIVESHGVNTRISAAGENGEVCIKTLDVGFRNLSLFLTKYEETYLEFPEAYIYTFEWGDEIGILKFTKL